MIGKKIIDLTLTYSSSISGFRAIQSKSVKVDGWNAKNLEIYSHAGTHMDAPFHFGVSDKTIEDIDPQRFIVKCRKAVIDVAEDNYLITTTDIQHTLELIEPGEGLLIQTGWSKHLGEDRYRNSLPRLSPDLAEIIVKKGITLIGVEPPSVADVNNLEEVTEIHQILLKAELLILEGLVNLEKLTGNTCTVIALPIKIENGDGAPARVIAIED